MPVSWPVMSAERPGQETLVQFVAESPLARTGISAFVQRLARTLPAGARVLDAGAGEAPYRVLFEHCRYARSDWEQSEHAAAHESDVLAPLHRMPLEDGSFDVVLNTQVLEHVDDPSAVLREFRRLLVPGGELWLTAPFVWELHEEPHDYFRYTSHGLRALVEGAGFTAVEIEPIGGYFTTVAQLLSHCGSSTGLDRRGLAGRAVTAVMARTARPLARLDRLDRRHALPLAYACRARRPDA